MPYFCPSLPHEPRACGVSVPLLCKALATMENAGDFRRRRSLSAVCCQLLDRREFALGRLVVRELLEHGVEQLNGLRILLVLEVERLAVLHGHAHRKLGLRL